MWAPDIYEGAPAPVTAFVAVVSKAAVFALLLRFFTATGAIQAAPLTVVLGGIAVLSMLAGNLLALLHNAARTAGSHPRRRPHRRLPRSLLAAPRPERGLCRCPALTAGIPLTVGFIAKFYAVASGVDGHNGVLLGTLVAGSIIGLYYYLRIIVAMAAPTTAMPESRAPAASRIRAEPLGHAVLAALVLLLIGLGAYPTPLLILIRATAAMAAH